MKRLVAFAGRSETRWREWWNSPNMPEEWRQWILTQNLYKWTSMWVMPRVMRWQDKCNGRPWVKK